MERDKPPRLTTETKVPGQAGSIGRASSVNGAAPTTAGYEYDAAGRQTSRPGSGPLVWDGEGELTAVGAAGSRTSMLYDANGERLTRTDSSGTTVYLPGGQEIRVEDGEVVSAVRYYSFDGQSVKLLFDGSDVGVGAGVDALAVVDARTLLLSFDRPVSLWPAGTVDDSDLVRFRADSLGESTGGSFDLVFDGSDVGLTTEGEDVDAVELLSGGGLLLSTRRRALVPGARGGGADLFLFAPSELGARTRGSWRVLSRGRTLGLRGPAERVDSLAAAPGTLLLGTAGPFSVAGMAGTSSDVLALAGFRRPGPPSFFLRGAALGVGSANVDAIDLPS